MISIQERFIIKRGYGIKSCLNLTYMKSTEKENWKVLLILDPRIETP